MIFGIDYLGGGMFPDVIKRNHPVGFGAGFFMRTFKSPWGIMQWLADKGPEFCPLQRLQGPWTNHLYNPKLHDKAIFQGAERISKLAEKYPETIWQFSPVCESDSTSKAWSDLFLSLDKRVSNKVELVCSVNRGTRVRNRIIETHGSIYPPTSGKSQYSYDGTDSFDADVLSDIKKSKHAKAFFFWCPRMNLKYRVSVASHQPDNVRKNDSSPPQSRIAKPTVHDIKGLEALSWTPKRTPTIQAGNIWKTTADRSHTPRVGREGKPVLIAVDRAAEATLWANGKLLDRSGPPTLYTDGKRWVYRFNKFGYTHGNVMADIKVGNKKIGTIAPFLRAGTFR